MTQKQIKEFAKKFAVLEKARLKAKDKAEIKKTEMAIQQLSEYLFELGATIDDISNIDNIVQELIEKI